MAAAFRGDEAAHRSLSKGRPNETQRTWRTSVRRRDRRWPRPLANLVGSVFTQGEFFVMLPRGGREWDRRDWDPHTSYHLDGTLHMKSYGNRVVKRKNVDRETDGGFSRAAGSRSTHHLGEHS